MGRFTFDGKEKSPTDSEWFNDIMEKEAGAVECSVCKVKIGQGKLGESMNVCIECLEYVCDDHLYRHPNCSNGR
jgi:hypothetical protein